MFKSNNNSLQYSLEADQHNTFRFGFLTGLLALCCSYDFKLFKCTFAIFTLFINPIVHC